MTSANLERYYCYSAALNKGVATAAFPGFLITPNERIRRKVGRWGEGSQSDVAIRPSPLLMQNTVIQLSRSEQLGGVLKFGRDATGQIGLLKFGG